MNALLQLHGRGAAFAVLPSQQVSEGCKFAGRLTALSTAVTAGHATVEVLPSQQMVAVSLELDIHVQGKHDSGASVGMQAKVAGRQCPMPSHGRLRFSTEGRCRNTVGMWDLVMHSFPSCCSMCQSCRVLCHTALPSCAARQVLLAACLHERAAFVAEVLHGCTLFLTPQHFICRYA